MNEAVKMFPELHKYKLVSHRQERGLLDERGFLVHWTPRDQYSKHFAITNIAIRYLYTARLVMPDSRHSMSLHLGSLSTINQSSFVPISPNKVGLILHGL